MSAFDVASALADMLCASGFAARVGIVVPGEYAVVVDHTRIAFVTIGSVKWAARLDGETWVENPWFVKVAA